MVLIFAPVPKKRRTGVAHDLRCQAGILAHHLRQILGRGIGIIAKPQNLHGHLRHGGQGVEPAQRGHGFRRRGIGAIGARDCGILFLALAGISGKRAHLALFRELDERLLRQANQGLTATDSDMDKRQIEQAAINHHTDTIGRTQRRRGPRFAIGEGLLPDQ